ncbi:hypothetical protein CQW23_20153 [Capsicum baccatum]|uniref:Ubiquitin-like protease family profile domain-containing protein n=1 Tax=Capsicum baccatum TaxID=33114 RepID=A0A2G2W7X4_CAPBA|nr:hypothetical protein CQW23_20153 [Capsicum baccatum]
MKSNSGEASGRVTVTCVSGGADLPWHLIDEVYIPINCGDEFHWALVVVVIKERRIRVYDSMSLRKRSGLFSEIQKLAKILPTYLDMSVFLEQKVRIDWSMIEACRDKIGNPFDVQYIEGITQQIIGSLVLYESSNLLGNLHRSASVGNLQSGDEGFALSFFMRDGEFRKNERAPAEQPAEEGRGTMDQTGKGKQKFTDQPMRQLRQKRNVVSDSDDDDDGQGKQPDQTGKGKQKVTDQPMRQLRQRRNVISDSDDDGVLMDLDVIADSSSDDDFEDVFGSSLNKNIRENINEGNQEYEYGHDILEEEEEVPEHISEAIHEENQNPEEVAEPHITESMHEKNQNQAEVADPHIAEAVPKGNQENAQDIHGVNLVAQNNRVARELTRLGHPILAQGGRQRRTRAAYVNRKCFCRPEHELQITTNFKKARASNKGGSLHTSGAQSQENVRRKLNRYLQSIEDFCRTLPDDSQDLSLSKERNERIWLDMVDGMSRYGYAYGLPQRTFREFYLELEGLGSSQDDE